MGGSPVVQNGASQQPKSVPGKIEQDASTEGTAKAPTEASVKTPTEVSAKMPKEVSATASTGEASRQDIPAGDADTEEPSKKAVSEMDALKYSQH